MWLVLALAAFAQDPDSDSDSAGILDLSSCGLTVKREVTPSIETALPAGSPGCAVRMMVDVRGRVADVQPVDCPEAVVAAIRPDLDKWRFDRGECPTEDVLAFDTLFESSAQTWLIPPLSPEPSTVFVPPEGTQGCLMAVTLLPDGSVENTRVSDPACTMSLGGSGWNPERFWKAEIEGLRCQATFTVRDGQANNIDFTGCGGPSRMALVSFVERATWATGSTEPVAFDVRFRMRDDDSTALERASQEARLIRSACEQPSAPNFLARKTQIPAMPARWAIDQSELAAYCRLRVHLDATATPTRIDAVLCNGVYGPRAASAATQWTYKAPTCGEEPVPSEVVVLVPFAKRIIGGGFQDLFGGESEVIDLLGTTLSRHSDLDHCEMWIDVPSNGKIRVTTSDLDECYVTPTSVPAIARRTLIKWAEVTDEWDIFCDSTFTAHTMSTDHAELGACYLETAALSREAIADWNWSVLGRQSQKYTVHWRYRLD